jgi:hypothetical protein
MFDKQQLLYLRDVLIRDMSRESYIKNDFVDDIMKVIRFEVGDELLEYHRLVELLMQRNNGSLDNDDPVAMEILKRYQYLHE